MRYLLVLIVAFFCLGIAKAQVVVSGDICNHLISSGRVSLIQDSRLTALLSADPKSYYVGSDDQQDANAKLKVRGYRIRVFSGNQQSTSKNRAYKIQSEFNDKMPDLSTYVTFKTPNWRLMVGDYRSSEEANSMLRILRKDFPAYSKDMFVVSEDIEL